MRLSSTLAKNPLNIVILQGEFDPLKHLAEDDVQVMQKILTQPQVEVKLAERYTPSDPSRPWRDFLVQQGVRRFLREVIQPDWIRNHPHSPCSGIYVDEWGRRLCKYIQACGPVDGAWENPTHFCFYAYDNFQTEQYYGIRINTFLSKYCNIYLP